MSMTDPIADMLTRIRNALMVERAEVDVPFSKMKEGIAAVMVKEGYLRTYKKMDDSCQGTLRLYLKYGPEGQKVVHEIRRTSKPGLRVYSPVEDLGRVRDGIGIAIVSTSKGVLSDRDCRAERVGGEVLCSIW